MSFCPDLSEMIFRVVKETVGIDHGPWLHDIREGRRAQHRVSEFDVEPFVVVSRLRQYGRVDDDSDASGPEFLHLTDEIAEEIGVPFSQFRGGQRFRETLVVEFPVCRHIPVSVERGQTVDGVFCHGERIQKRVFHFAAQIFRRVVEQGVPLSPVQVACRCHA
jgi:hypothetical protein